MVASGALSVAVGAFTDFGLQPLQLSVPTSAPLVGTVLTFTGALSWAIHYLFIRLGMERRGVSDVVLVTVVLQAVIVVPIAVAIYGPGRGLTLGLTIESVALFAAGGLASGLLGRVFQYESTRRVGASRTSPIVASAGLVSAILAVVVLEESVTLFHVAGIILVVVGVAATSWETASDAPDEPLRETGVALIFPLVSAIFYGVEPLFVKLGLRSGTPALVGLAIMAVAAAVTYGAVRRLRGPIGLRASLTGIGGWYAMAAGIAGAIGFVFYIWALSIAPVVVVLPLFQTVPLLVVGLSFIFMPSRLERVTWRLGLAAAVVVLGASIVSLAAA